MSVGREASDTMPPGSGRPRVRRWLRRGILTLAGLFLGPTVAVAGFLTVVPPPTAVFDPEPWAPDPATIPSREVTVQVDARPLSDQSVSGPEDIATDAQGRIYTGDRNGVIWRFPAAGGPAEKWAVVGGRPLGMAFAPDGRLIVANHGVGLQAVSPAGTVEMLLDEVAGELVLFANDLDVSTAGIVYVSDSSFRYNTTTLGTESSSYLLPDALDGRASGRLLSYDLATGESGVLADGLYFPNGVALSADETTLWIAESTRYRIRTLDLADGGQDVPLENLPGTPDNIDRGPDGDMLIAIYERNPTLDTLVLPHEIGRQILIRLPTSLFVNEDDPLTGSIVVAAPDGTIRHLLTGLTPAPTSIHPAGDRWYLGALLGQPVRWINAPT